MPTTVTPRIYTGAFPTIANDLKYAIYAASNPLALVASQTFPAVGGGHPVRGVSFPGLDRVNYIFRLFEMSGGVPIRTLIDNFNFNPDSSEFLYRVPETMIVGDTIGLVDGAGSFTFDGTGGKPDWRGWVPSCINPPGMGPLLPGAGLDYIYDALTGTCTLNNGVTFAAGVRYLVEFEPQTIGASPGVPGGRLFTEVLRVTADITLTADDIGKKILLDPASDKITVTMPVIGTVVENRVTFFETVQQTAAAFCVEIITVGGTQWRYGYAGRTSMYMMPNESFECYNSIQSAVASWRVQNATGNFLTVGRSFSSDTDEADELNAVLCDGRTGDVNKYARLYNDYILRLDPSKVVTFATWATDKTKWSYADGSTPAVFRFPDRRNKHERNTAAAQLPGVAGAANVGAHDFFLFANNDQGGTVDADHVPQVSHSTGGNLGYTIANANGAASLGKATAGSGENRVSDYSINKFVNV